MVRRPRKLRRSGAPSRASTSASVKNEMTSRSKRLGGTASTRPIDPACSGWRSAAKRNNERTADRRALRVRALLCRSISRWVEEPARSGRRRDLRCPTFAGALPVSLCTNSSRRQKVSLISSDGVGAGTTLVGQALGKKAWSVGAEGSHGRLVVAASRRAAARARSSGAADKYQLFRSRNNWYLLRFPVIPIPASLCV